MNAYLFASAVVVGSLIGVAFYLYNKPPKRKALSLEELLVRTPPSTIYEHYDFPRVFTTELPNRNTYLYLNVEDSYEKATFVCKRVSDLDLILLRVRSLSLLEWMIAPKDPLFLIESVYNDANVKPAKKIKDIPSEWLPTADRFLVETPVPCPKPLAHTKPTTDSVVFVCPIRYIECGNLESKWCSTCPRKAQ